MSTKEDLARITNNGAIIRIPSCGLTNTTGHDHTELSSDEHQCVEEQICSASSPKKKTLGNERRTSFIYSRQCFFHFESDRSEERENFARGINDRNLPVEEHARTEGCI